MLSNTLSSHMWFVLFNSFCSYFFVLLLFYPFFFFILCFNLAGSTLFYLLWSVVCSGTSSVSVEACMCSYRIHALQQHNPRTLHHLFIRAHGCMQYLSCTPCFLFFFFNSHFSSSFLCVSIILQVESELHICILLLPWTYSSAHIKKS